MNESQIVRLFEKEFVPNAIERFEAKSNMPKVTRTSVEFIIRQARVYFSSSVNREEFIAAYQSEDFNADFDLKAFEEAIAKNRTLIITRENIVEKIVLLFENSTSRDVVRRRNKLRRSDIIYGFSPQFFCGLLFLCGSD